MLDPRLFKCQQKTTKIIASFTEDLGTTCTTATIKVPELARTVICNLPRSDIGDYTYLVFANIADRLHGDLSCAAI
jgi:hypothetical protein